MDPYADPDTGVLRNLFGIGDAHRLAQIETDLAEATIAGLEIRILPGSYDLAHLQDFHRAIFGRIYPWAGEIRTVAIAKTDMFCLPQHITSYAAEVFSGLRKEAYLRGLPRNDFADRLTHYFAEVNALHPFREGNGRTQRAFFGQLSREAGWRLAWANIDAEENVVASRAALRGDNALLRSMLERLVVPPRS